MTLDDLAEPEAPAADPFAAVAEPDPFAAVAEPEPPAETPALPEWAAPSQQTYSPTPLQSFAEDAAAGQEHHEDLFIRSAFASAMAPKMDRETGILTLARELGVSTSVAEADYDNLKQTYDEATFDTRKWRNGSPHTWEMVKRNPALAPLAAREETGLKTLIRAIWHGVTSDAPERDPMQELLSGGTPEELGKAAVPDPLARGKTTTEHRSPLSSASAWEKTKASGSAAVAGLNFSRLGFQRLMGQSSPEFLRRWTDARIEAQGTGFIETQGLEAVPVSMAQLAPSSALSMGAGLLGSLPGFLLRSPKVTKWGAHIFAGASSFIPEAGGAFNDFLEMKDDQGNPIDETTARNFALLYGALSATIEMAPFGTVAKGKLGVIGDFLATGDRKAFWAAVRKNPDFISLAKDIGLRWVKGAGAETGEEMAQAATKRVTDWMAKDLSAATRGTYAPQSFDWRGALDEQLETLQSTFLGTLGGAPFTAATTIAPHVLLQERANDARAANSGRALGEFALNSQIAKAAPKDVAELVERATAETGAPVTHIHVPTQKVTEFFQNQNINPAEGVRELLGEDAPKLMQEAATRGTFEVPVEAYLEKWGAHPIAPTILEDISTGPGRPSIREIREEQETQVRQVKDEAARIEKESLPAEGPEEARYIEELEKGLRASNLSDDEVRHGVTTHRAVLRTHAARTMRQGVTLEQRREDVYRQYITEAGLAPARASSPLPAREGPAPRDLGGAEGLGVGVRRNVLDDSFDVSEFADPEEQALNEAIAKEPDIEVSQNGPEAIAAARESVERMRNPEKKAQAQAFVDWAEGGAEGPMPAIADDLRKKLANEFGVVDPENPFPWDESGRSLERELPGEKKRGRGTLKDMPSALKKHFLLSRGTIHGTKGLKYSDFEQAAFHGGPHRGVEQTGFSLQKIGTGEGAQVYGWGIYFAGNRVVAERYRQALAPERLLIDERDKFSYVRPGEPGHAEGMVHARIRNALGQDKNIPDAVAFTVANLREDVARAEKAVESARKFDEADVVEDQEFRLKTLQTGLAFAMELQAHPERARLDRGQLYEAELPENDELLDYDKPLSEQSAGLLQKLEAGGVLPAGSARMVELEQALEKEGDTAKRAALTKELKTAMRETSSAKRVLKAEPYDVLTRANGGKRLYDDLTSALGGPQKASEFLRDAGVPGLRYLDQGSRQGGEGTHNYVIWDESRMPITRTFYQGMSRKLGRGETVTHDINPKLGNDIQVVQADGTELEGDLSRDSARRFLRSLHSTPAKPGPTDLNPDSGWTVRYFSSGTDKSTSRKFSDEKAIAIARVRELVGRAVLVYSSGDLATEPSEDVLAFHTLFAPLEINGTIKRVRLTLRETKNHGDGFYDLSPEDLEVESPGSFAEGQDGPKPNPRSTSPQGTIKVRALLEGVKGPKEVPLFDAAGKAQTFKETDPADPANPRGWVSITEEAGRKQFSIFFAPTADKSTFLHESGHIFLEMMRDAALKEDAPEQIKQDWQRIQNYLGVTGNALETEHHEKWARSFEAYLMEGKAPSAELESAFYRFKKWLTAIYKAAKNLNAPISDEMRGVFDRMLATDEEIAAQAQGMGLTQPIFTSAKEAGMTPEKYQDYLDTLTRTLSTTSKRAQLRLMKDLLRENERFWKEELKDTKKEMGKEYDALPEVQATQFLKTGQLSWASDEGVTRAATTQVQKLNRQAVVDMVGEEGAKRLARFLVAKDAETSPRKGQTTAEVARAATEAELEAVFGDTTDPGLHPDDLAEQFFPEGTTGKAALEAILARPEKSTWVNEQAQSRMEDRHPDALRERVEFEAIIAKGLHGDHTAKWLETEIDALHAKAGGTGEAPIAEVKRQAEAVVRRRGLKGLNPNQILRAERSAAEKALKAATAGNYAQAYVFKRQQLFNLHLHRFLTEAREERDSFETLASEMADDKSRARLGKASPIYRDNVDALLEAVGLKDAEERDLPLAGLGELVRAMEEASETVAFDIEGLGAILAKPKSWEALTVDEMRNVTAALKNIRQAARNMNTVIEGEARAEKAFVIEKLGEEIRAHLPDLGPDKNQDAMSAIERGAAAVSAFDGELLRPETMISWMGGGLNSTWWRAVFKPLNDAKIKESDLMRKTVKPIVEALHAVPENIRRRMNETVDGKALFPEHTAQKEGPTRRFHVLALFLNSGNESNLKRLTEGRNITPAQIAAAIDLLTKEETDWLQSILDSIETLGKDSFDLEERDSGVRPEKVRATPIATRHGTYRGGYFPLVGDSVGNQGKRVAGQELSSLMDPSFTRPGTSHSHLKSRAGRARYIVSLDLNVVQSHLAKAVHDIAFRESVKSVGSLLQSEEVQELMRRHLGEGRARTLWQWVKDAGSMRGAEVLTHAPGATRFVNGLKGRMGPAVLGYAVDVVMGDLGNPFVALASTTLKTKHLAAGMAEFITSPRETIAFVHEKSGEMRFRDNSFSSEFNRAMKSVTQTRNVATRVLDAFTANAFQVFEYSELVSTTGVWMGAYRQAMQEGQSDADAVTYANAVIRKIVPANSAIDKPEILRSKGGVAALLMFHGYMNTVYNLYRDAAHPLYTMALEGKGRPRTVAGVAARTLGIAVSVALVSEFLSGKGPEPSDGEDEAERWANWAKRKLLMSPLQAVPLLGEAVEGVAGAASGKRVSARGAPAAGVGIEIAKAVFKAQQEGKDDWDKVLGLVKAAGMMKGLPVRPLRALDYLHDLLVGDKELSAETPSALIYGLRDEQPANPLKPYAGTAAPAQ